MCKKTWELSGKEADCESCMPEIMPENYEAIEVYGVCNKQLIIGPSGIIDIDYNAVIKTIEIFGIVNKKDCLLKVATIFREALSMAENKHKLKAIQNGQISTSSKHIRQHPGPHR